MASTKLATLVIRTLAKPLANQIKAQVKQHETFRTVCVGLAQRMYQTEVRLRTNLLGEPAKHVRPLSETRAIENGANAIAEGFLFAVAAALILGETYRSSRQTSKRRDRVDEQLDELRESIDDVARRVDTFTRQYEERWAAESCRNDELTRIIERVVEIGLRGGWAEFEGTPLPLPRISLAPPRTSAASHTSELDAPADASHTDFAPEKSDSEETTTSTS